MNFLNCELKKMSDRCRARIWDRKNNDIFNRCSKGCIGSLCKSHLKSYNDFSKNDNKIIGWCGFIDEDVIYRKNDILTVTWNNNDIKKKIIEDINNGIIKKYAYSRYIRNKYINTNFPSIFKKNSNIKIKIQDYLGELSLLVKSFICEENKIKPIHIENKKNMLLKKLNKETEPIHFKKYKLLEEDEDSKEVLMISIEISDKGINNVLLSYDGVNYNDEFGIYYYSQQHGSNIIENRIKGGVNRCFKEVYSFNTIDKLFKLIHREKISK